MNWNHWLIATILGVFPFGAMQFIPNIFCKEYNARVLILEQWLFRIGISIQILGIVWLIFIILKMVLG